MKKFIAVLLTASALSTGAIAETPTLNDVSAANSWTGPNLNRDTVHGVKRSGVFGWKKTAFADSKDVLQAKAADGSLFSNITGDQNRVEVNQVKGGAHHAVVNIGGQAQAVLTAHNDTSVYKTDVSKRIDPLGMLGDSIKAVNNIHQKLSGAEGANKGVGKSYGKEKANNNKVTLDQVNAAGNHLAYVNIIGDDNTLAIRQDGSFQNAFVQLGDSGSNLRIDQSGSDNTASVQMMQGALIESQILQANADNVAHVIGAEQTGTFSTIDIDQTQANASIAMASFGNLNGANGGNNTVRIHQTGTAFANVATNGFGNTVVVNQGK